MGDDTKFYDFSKLTNDDIAEYQKLNPPAGMEELKAFAGKYRNISPLSVASEEAEGCCAKIKRAMAKGELDAATSWKCPTCSLEWRPRMVEGVKLWEAFPVFLRWTERKRR